MRAMSVLSIGLVLVCLACPSTRDDRPPPPPARIVQPSTDEVAQASTDEGEAPAAELEEVIEIAGEEPSKDGTAVPITPATPTPTQVQWRPVTIVADSDFHFVYLASGVLGQGSSGLFERKGDALELAADLQLPVGTVVGHWPDDVFAIDTQPAAPTKQGELRFEYAVSQYDARRRKWTELSYRNHSRWVGERLAVRKGWNSGVLVRDSNKLARIGSNKPITRVGPRMGKILLDTFEASAGELYTISQRPTGVHVQGHCRDFECVKQNAKKLPSGDSWSFSIQLPRQRKSLTIAAVLDIDGVPGNYLLHYELGGWKLDSLDRPATGLWANAEGGVWVQLGDRLWYRSATGTWLAAELPKGVTEYSAAMLGDLGELWLAANIGGKTQVFATAAMPPT